MDFARDGWNLELLRPLYKAVMALPGDPRLAEREPNDLDQIRRMRPDGPRDLRWKPTDAELIDRIHGALVCRSTGCALGRPVEGIAGGTTPDQPSRTRDAIRHHLIGQGDWPLHDYFRSAAGLGAPQSHRENIAYMEADDDIHYTLTGLGVLEDIGPSFRWTDVATWWLSHIPIRFICTAEAQAILNFQNGWSILSPGLIEPEQTRRPWNPYREWIGAQIRSDGWAWAAAGKPELAAQMAWEDAHWTHERNGIYGAMMFAAIQSAAFVESDPRRLVEIGLSEIPAECRLALLTRRCLQWIEEEPSWEACMARVEDACRELHWVHTINNALVCVLSLFYSNMDTVEGPCLAVSCGLDTDCNGATVGSIVGAASGRRALREELAAPLHDTIRPLLIGFGDVKMAELAQRWAVVWRRFNGDQ